MKKPLEKIDTKRLMKYAEKLQDYDFTLQYVEGVNNEVADALSRNPVKQPDPSEMITDNALMVNLVNHYEGRDICSMTDIKTIAKLDQDYQAIIQLLLNDIPVTAIPPDHPARMYKADWNLLAVQEGLITLGDRILVPKGARKDILRSLHISHMGRNKTNALAKSLYYWKHMARDIEQLVESCDKCQIHSSFQQKETLKQTFAEGPMDMNSADLMSHAGKNYLVHADRFSNFLWIYQLRTTDVKNVINALWSTFYQMGFPKRLRTDNGPQFISQEFISACRTANIEQEWSDPYYPTSNGHSEKMVAVAKSMIKKASSLPDIGIMVMVYNATPSVQTGVSPAEMLMQRKLRTCLPTLSSPRFVPSEKIIQAAEKNRQHATKIKAKYDSTAKDLPPLRIGSRVRVFNHKTSRWDIEGKVIQCDKKTGRSYRILTLNGVYIFRNRRFIRLISRFDQRPNRWGGMFGGAGAHHVGSQRVNINRGCVTGVRLRDC